MEFFYFMMKISWNLKFKPWILRIMFSLPYSLIEAYFKVKHSNLINLPLIPPWFIFIRVLQNALMKSSFPKGLMPIAALCKIFLAHLGTLSLHLVDGRWLKNQLKPKLPYRKAIISVIWYAKNLEKGTWQL